MVFSVEVLTLGTTCYGENNGNAVAQVTDGTMPYSYLWSTGDTTSTSSNLAQGSYSLTVTDAEGLTAIAQFEITQPDSLVTEILAMIGCEGGNSGSVQAFTTGGAFPYSYLWSTGDTTTITDGLSTGTYGVTVTDANGCSSQSAIFLTQPIELNASLQPYSTSCPGMANGGVAAEVWGGLPPYTYTWSTGDTIAELSGLTEGFYELVVVDANGCSLLSQVTVDSPAPINLNVQGVSSTSCHGGSDGAIFANAFGGTPEYTYVWSNGDTGSFVDSLSAGTYTATITDAVGCTGIGTVNVLEPEPLQTFLFGSSVCNGIDDGTAEVVASGGTLPYTYLWSTGATTDTLTNLAPDTYYVTVTDINQCSTSDSLLVNLSNVILDASITSSSVTCPLGNDGMASVAPTGGVAPYTYHWNNGATDSVANNLTAGIYTVVIQDLFNCYIVRTIEITEPAPIMANAVVQNLSCGSTGSIFLNPSGGTPPYTFEWTNNTATTDSLVGLDQGAYAVNITDANNCVKQFFIDVEMDNNPPTVLTTDLTINLDADGTATIDATQINAGSFDDCGIDTMFLDLTTFDCNSIGENTVTLTVRDENNEANTGTATVTVIDNVAPLVEGQDDTLYLDENGSALLSLSQVNIGSTDNCGIDSMYLTDTLFDCYFLGENEIVLYAADAGGNVGTDTITITVLDTFPTTMSCEEDLIFTICEGEVINANYALPSILGNCSEGEPTLISGVAIGDPLDTGINTITYQYTDASGITTSCSFDITVLVSSPVEITVDDVTPATEGNSDGSISITVSSGTPPYQYEWTLVGGTTVASNDEDPTGLPSGAYQVIITDILGCQKTFLVEITTGINDPELVEKIDIYPNPTSSVLFVKMDLPVNEGDKIRVFSLNGNQVSASHTGGLEKILKANEHLVKLNLSDFANGVYVVQLIINEAVVTKRIVVNK
ncbi:MAG TPA: T9SS type A sorting domain-containing protein [Phaeodactylibacter sp.]|nr:T9SS type A sorting domain-containing protein [Phaeodactylibacter sp.]